MFPVHQLPHGKGAPLQAAQETQQEPSSSPFALDIRLIENSDTTPLINLTDDGCGSSCPSACTTSTAD